MYRLLIILTVLFYSATALADTLPNSTLTPGVTRDGITSEDLCPIAHTPAIRNVPASEAKQVYKEYGLSGNHTGYCVDGCEVDHLISLELGGSNDIKNLWPQPYVGEWNAHLKDKLENKLHSLVCSNSISLSDAQHEISTDWISAYKKYVNN